MYIRVSPSPAIPVRNSRRSEADEAELAGKLKNLGYVALCIYAQSEAYRPGPSEKERHTR